MPKTDATSDANQEGKYYRPNVGIMVANAEGNRLLWCRRVGSNAWQFPQGGIDKNESSTSAAWRELREETGLHDQNTHLVSSLRKWIPYQLPHKKNIRANHPLRHSRFIGQKQRWYLFQLTGDDSCIQLDAQTHPEFDQWQWVSYWYPLGQIVSFKQPAYRQALTQLAKPFQGLTQASSEHTATGAD
ncbi:MAG: RNA pyrophosphohydrolase [Gammaproteobacteria bacterium]